MKRYEVIREIFISCSNKWQIDSSFTDEVHTDDTYAQMLLWFRGSLPGHTAQTADDGCIVYTITGDVPERYTFAEF